MNSFYLIDLFKVLQTCVLVVKATSRETGNVGWISKGCWNFLLPVGHFMWHRASHCIRAFILLCSLFFLPKILSVAILRWQVLTLSMNSRLPLFWSTWSRARGLGPRLCQICWGSNYSYCIALEQSAWKLGKGLAFVFPWIDKNAEKTVASTQGGFSPLPQTVFGHKIHNFF